ncbi:Predicted Fe2+/Mn2+ transporter, VIT1/CCC1 family [Paracoccus solventivorans]|uniref:Predicted Fe2+/Mn2+ transporter, VIT1/CCC1 family n=1 Tax=Paracoccus solventivorans TaxID=53463 RepID=A0A1M7GC55_9RHOB|nr:VIT family protein [Paracoccus solventivorans]SHM13811.1 Predicted Fe2+/Mn2+ transporter, VIT1/CCC1 family [Paracoccus solventivorans]
MTRNTHPSAHPDDPHYINRSNWLRAAVLGANDGIVSMSSLLVGVAAAGPDPQAVALAGVAGLTAGALSMAAGEYVSVSSQADIEAADIHRERQALHHEPEIELEELVQIYIGRGLAPDTALLVACELTEHDALGAHLRDELGLTDELSANPMQAALASGVTFTVAGGIPVLASVLAPAAVMVPVVLVVTLLALAALGVLGARAGGAPVLPALGRVLVWGVFAMAITAAIGHVFGAVI